MIEMRRKKQKKKTAPIPSTCLIISHFPLCVAEKSNSLAKAIAEAKNNHNIATCMVLVT